MEATKGSVMRAGILLVAVGAIIWHASGSARSRDVMLTHNGQEQAGHVDAWHRLASAKKD